MTEKSSCLFLNAQPRLTYRCKESERRQECLFSEHCFLYSKAEALESPIRIAYSGDASND